MARPVGSSPGFRAMCFVTAIVLVFIATISCLSSTFTYTNPLLSDTDTSSAPPTRSRIQDQSIYNATLQGNHELVDGIKLNWSGVYSIASATTPDWSEYQTVQEIKPDINGIPSTSPQTLNIPFYRIWTRNSDRDYTGYLNLSYHKNIRSVDGTISAGGLYRDKLRDNHYNEWDLIPKTSQAGQPIPFDFQLTPDKFQFNGVSAAQGSSINALTYTATEKILAYYIPAKLLFLNRLEVLGGIRVENTTQGWKTVQDPRLVYGAFGKVPYTDVLPSVQLKFIITSKQNLRLSYFSAINRPGFFEYIPFTIVDDNFSLSGNPNLKHATSDNIDMRYEFFPSSVDQVLAGVFYKRIFNPIESAAQFTGTSRATLRPNNFGTATKLLSLNPAAQIIVKGSFVSLGTKENPNWITGEAAYANPTAYKLTTLQDPNTDPALKPDGKMWGGIQCDLTANLVNIKWTHLDFAGGTASSSNPPLDYKSGYDLFVIKFTNANGFLILEDSWIYGSTTDALRANGGKIHIMRNTVEKLAYNDGDCFNVKNSTTGDMAYNVIAGTAKGGTKASNKGTYGTVQTYINMYNNTYLTGGWRSVDPDRGANVNYEQGAKGNAYNNIMVNCKTGLRILENPAADTANCHYGYNLSYGDTSLVVNSFYPPTHATHASDHDIPNPASFYPGFPAYKLGQIYSAPQLVGQNNPNFKNYPLPVSGKVSLNNFVGNYDLHLLAGSPAIGKGFTDFTPIDATAAVSNTYLKATVTKPNMDLGAYPTDGTGNQH